MIYYVLIKDLNKKVKGKLQNRRKCLECITDKELILDYVKNS